MQQQHLYSVLHDDDTHRMKTLELEDKQLETEKELRELPDEDPQFEQLLQQLVDIVTERDNIVQQVDQERIR